MEAPKKPEVKLPDTAKAKGFVMEFKEFVMRGNVMDMAVGIIVGGAFTAIVTALVDNLIMPFIGIIIGGIDFSSLSVTVGTGEHAAVLAYGSFIQAVINFLLIALVLFLLIKGLNSLRRPKSDAEEAIPTCPFCLEVVNEGATKCSHCGSELPVE